MLVSKSQFLRLMLLNSALELKVKSEREDLDQKHQLIERDLVKDLLVEAEEEVAVVVVVEVAQEVPPENPEKVVTEKPESTEENPENPESPEKVATEVAK